MSVGRHSLRCVPIKYFSHAALEVQPDDWLTILLQSRGAGQTEKDGGIQRHVQTGS